VLDVLNSYQADSDKFWDAMTELFKTDSPIFKPIVRPNVIAVPNFICQNKVAENVLYEYTHKTFWRKMQVTISVGQVQGAFNAAKGGTETKIKASLTMQKIPQYCDTYWTVTPL
jgi:hypothetical protein